MSTPLRLLLALDDQALLGPVLQVVELLEEAWQIHKRMRISRLTRLQEVFRFGETRRTERLANISDGGEKKHFDAAPQMRAVIQVCNGSRVRIREGPLPGL